MKLKTDSREKQWNQKAELVLWKINTIDKSLARPTEKKGEAANY